VFGHYSTLVHGHKSRRGWAEWYAATAGVALWGLASPGRKVLAYRIQKLREGHEWLPVSRRSEALLVGGGPRDPAEFREDFRALLRLLQTGKIHPVAERLPLSQARHAHELLETSAEKGKLVLVPAGARPPGRRQPPQRAGAPRRHGLLAAAGLACSLAPHPHRERPTVPVTHPVVEVTNYLPLGPVLLVLLFGLVTFVVWIGALVDALRYNDQDWTRAGQSKLLWVLLIALLGVIGAILYFAMARPSLRRS